MIEGGYRKYIIIARDLRIKVGNKMRHFDYGAFRYPEGMTGDSVMYFQHDAIKKIIFEGLKEEKK